MYLISCSGVTLQSQRDDPDAIYGTVDDDVYATVGDTGQSYYSMVCLCLHVCVFMLSFVCVCVRVCVSACVRASVFAMNSYSHCTISNSKW